MRLHQAQGAESEARGAASFPTTVARSSASSSSASSPAQVHVIQPGGAATPCSVEAAHIRQLLAPESPSSPKEIAELLHEIPHSDPKMVGQVLSEPTARSLSVLQEYANGFVFKEVAFDVALRVYLGRFVLPGEAQKIDRILEAFAKAYFPANPRSRECPSQDAVHTLAFAVLLLNTDAHNPRLAKRFKMTKSDFIGNFHRLRKGTNGSMFAVPDRVLAKCYDQFAMDAITRIMRKPRELLADETELEFPGPTLGLDIETSFDGRACVVKRYANDRHSSRRPAVESEVEPSLAGWVIVAVGDDNTRQIGYALARYLLRTAPRPVVIRFCDPSVYYESLAE